MAFNMDNTKYTLNLAKEELETDTDGSSNSYIIQLQAANRIVTLTKKVRNGGEPEFSMEGPGMTEAEQLEFVKNWVTVVYGEADQILGMGGQSGGQAQAPEGVKPFFMLFDHFFKDKILESLAISLTGADAGEDEDSETTDEEDMDDEDPSTMNE